MKIGRNDPCPCGSGQKYKKCCEEKDEAARSAELVANAVARAATETDGAPVTSGPTKGTGSRSAPNPLPRPKGPPPGSVKARKRAV
jgi:hypothetical protein